MASEVQKLIVAIETVGVDQAQKELDKLKKKAKETESAAKGAQAGVGGFFGGFKKFRGATSALTNTTGQLSVQLQDVAVQAQQGTDGLRIFAQQGPQIASIFGPTGAVVGALVAVGAIIAGPFVKSFFAANEAIEETAKRLKEVTDGVNELTEKEKAARLSILTTEMREQQETISSLEEQLKEAVEEFNLFNSGQTTTGTVISQVTGGLLTYKEALNESAGAVNTANAALEEARAKFNEQLRLAGLLTGKTKELTKEEKANAEAVESSIQSGREQVQVLGMSAIEAELFRLQMKGATEEQIEARRVQLEATAAFKADQEAREEAKKKAEQEARSRESFIAGVVEQTVAFGNSRAELLRHRAAQHDLTVEQQYQVEVLAELIEKKEADAEATKNQRESERELTKAIAEEREKRAAEEQRINERVQQMEAAERELKGEGLLNAEQGEIDSLNRRLEKIKQFEREGTITTQQSIEARKNLNKQYNDFAIKSAGDALNALGQTNEKAFQAAKLYNVGMAVMNTYTGATKALAELPPPLNFIVAAATVANGLAQVQQIRSQQYSGRALGGQVRGGESYVVGERGPEVLTMGSSGRIIPNDKLGGQQQVVNKTANVTFQISTVDARGFDQLLQSRRGQIVNMVNSAMNDQGRRGVA